MLSTLLVRASLFLVLSLFILAGCMSTGHVPEGKAHTVDRNDLAIQTSLNSDFATKDMGLYLQICIKVFEGRVLLAGHVPSKKLKEEAVAIAKNTPGVKEVIDVMKVAPSRAPWQYWPDTWKATYTATNLLGADGVDSSNVKVEVVDNIIYLLGRAYSEKERQKMIDSARMVDGTEKVIAYINLVDKKKIKK